MRNWGIQRRVLFIALLPAALIALVLSAYYSHTRINEVETATVGHARSLARQLAPLSEFGVLSGNRELLRSIARSALEEDRTLAQVAILDADGLRLAAAGARAPAGPAPATGELVTVAQPIRRTLLGGIERPADGGPPAIARGDVIGRVVLRVDLAPVRSEQLAVLLESLTITGLALALTALLAVRIGRGVTGPVQQLTRTVERLRGGDLGARPATGSGGELGSLEQGVTAMAEEIERTHAQLRERVDVATHELQEALTELEARNRELEEARLEAEAASEFKSRFLANVSHEIRTPMNSILGFTELLQQADLDPIHADYLATIHSSAQSLLTLLNGILDLSKMESGRMELEPVDTDINTLLLEVFQLLAPHAFHKGVEFIVTPIPPSSARVHTDPVRLKQVLINLASNAVKFTDHGHVRISGTTTPRAGGGIALTFCVEDTGSGIPPQAQVRLFQAFAQGEHARRVRDDTAAVAGTGLGLHIASDIVFLMGGLIEFESEPGAGSAFWFTLDLDAPAEAPASAAEPPWERRRVLYVDADPTTRAACMEVLALAAVGADATAEPATDPPDPARHEAVLVQLPAERVARGDIAPVDPELAASGLPLLAHCHAHAPDTRQAVSAAGYAAIVPKTPDPAALRATIDAAVDGADPRRPAAGPDDAVLASARAQGLRVLVVDDHPLNLKLLESYLAQPGIDVVAATTSDDAIRESRARRFDAILMDIHLPGRDGIATAGRIRSEDGPNRDTPIIAITADAFAEQSQRAIAAGINGMLLKPISRRTLMQKLALWCAPGTGHEGPGAAADAPPSGERPVVDADAALERAGGRPEVMRELFGILCRSLPASRDALAAAQERGDPEAVRAAAHRLRGAAVYCAVPRLEHAVAEVERLARAGEREALEAALARLYAAIDELLEYGRRRDAAE